MSFKLLQPYSPAFQAGKLWSTTSSTPMDAQPLKVLLREDDISRPREQNHGGLNIERHTHDVVGFYDPRTVSMRGPSLSEGSLPGTRHGARPIAADELPEPAPKTMYSLGNTGAMLMNPVTLAPRGFPCTACTDASSSMDIRPYSLAALIYSVQNAQCLRGMLAAAGVVVVSDALARQTPSCVCDVFGDSDGFRDGVYNLATQYNDVAIVHTPDPVRDINMINTSYVQRVLDAARVSVNEGLQINYARVEGNRAYLQDYPQFRDLTPSTDAYLQRALAEPKASARNRALLARLTGLPEHAHAHAHAKKK